MSFRYVWVLVGPNNSVTLFESEKLAFDSFDDESPRRQEIAPKNYTLTLRNGTKYRLSLEKVIGSNGLA